ncbi:MAG: hypothetical protein HY781_09005 [Chloroflexi bacterium]|nr:hypothetical protein [Chloroflexota bacterium]
MKIKPIQVIITASALILIGAHIIWPKLSIDSITAILIAIAVVPWLGTLFKSVELPGGVKVEYQELIKAKDNAERAGLLAPLNKKDNQKLYIFEQIAEEDPNLALAGLRIEIEKRLRTIAESNKLEVKKEGIATLSRRLVENDLLTQQERSAILDISFLMNSAAHGYTVDRNTTNWAMEVGPRILKTLDNKIAKKK